MVSDSELEDICEEVLEELFDEGYTVEECEPSSPKLSQRLR